jgi:exodeoxyribonuclease VII large subunit
VTQALNYVKRTLENDERLRNVAIRGEVTQYNPLDRGVRFRLREPAGAQLSCWAWSEAAESFPEIGNGIEIVAVGKITIYAYGSECQLEVSQVLIAGAGKLAALYERIKKKLQSEGLFDLDRKRPLPKYPFRVALVSSPQADGANDFIKKLRADAPFVGIQFVKTVVQGPLAAQSIADAIGRASNYDVDVVVIARGGGSEDDRLPFNEEVVARAIAACRHPVLTAIGHQADHHIADDVADATAPTPSTAATMLTSGFVAVRPLVRELPQRLERAFGRANAMRAVRVKGALARLAPERVESVLRARRQQTTILGAASERAFADGLRRRRDRISGFWRRLDQRNPRALVATRVARVESLGESLLRLVAHQSSDRRRRLANAEQQLSVAAERAFEGRRSRLRLLEAQLDGSNPEAILQQGYAIVRVEGRAVRDAAALAPGERIEAQLARGSVLARVEETLSDG